MCAVDVHCGDGLVTLVMVYATQHISGIADDLTTRMMVSQMVISKYWHYLFEQFCALNYMYAYIYIYMCVCT